MSMTSLRMFVTGFKKISIQRYPISMTDADYDYILDEIELREKNDLERNVSVNSDKE